MSPAAQAWAVTKDSKSVAVLEAYAQKFPASVYATLAKARIAELRKAANERVARLQPKPSPGVSAIESLSRQSDEAIAAKLPKWAISSIHQGIFAVYTYNLNKAYFRFHCNSGGLGTDLYSLSITLPARNLKNIKQEMMNVWLEIDGNLENIRSKVSAHDNTADIYQPFNPGRSFEYERRKLFEKLSSGRVLKVHIRELGVSELFTLKGSKAALAYCEKRVAER